MITAGGKVPPALLITSAIPVRLIWQRCWVMPGLKESRSRDFIWKIFWKKGKYCISLCSHQDRGSDLSPASATWDWKHLNKNLINSRSPNLLSPAPWWSASFTHMAARAAQNTDDRDFAPGLPSRALPSRQVRGGQTLGQTMLSQGTFFLWACTLLSELWTSALTS